MRRIARFVRKLAEAQRIRQLPTVTFAAPGHFYSPLPDLRGYVHSPRMDVQDVDLNIEGQLELAERLQRHPFQPDRWSDNQWFGRADASILAAMIQEFNPKRIVEVGSGWSSAVMLDHSTAHLTLIEPHLDRLYEILRPGDQPSIVEDRVQAVPLGVFEELEEDDVLFVDSSHVVKVGSDVHWIVFEVLPRLSAGVLIHFHDVFWPFEYPESWIREGRAWNEAYMLRALLAGSRDYRIELFGSYLEGHHRGLVGDASGSLWMRRV